MVEYDIVDEVTGAESVAEVNDTLPGRDLTVVIADAAIAVSEAPGP